MVSCYDDAAGEELVCRARNVHLKRRHEEVNVLVVTPQNERCGAREIAEEVALIFY